MKILDKNKKMKSWNMALNMQKIDGYEPNRDFLKFIEDEVYGKITLGDIIRKLDEKYKHSTET